jgi:Fe-S oxidoreductase
MFISLPNGFQFLSPQALSEAWRYMADSRDEGGNERDVVFSPHGAFNCHFAGACSDVCPKGVDPGFAIQALKQDMFLNKVGARKCKHGGELLPKSNEFIPNEKIPVCFMFYYGVGN